MYFNVLFKFLDENRNFKSIDQILQSDEFNELLNNTTYYSPNRLVNEESDQEFLDNVLIPLILSNENENNEDIDR